MPRIRKKTSNRGSTNERKKILHKVRESRKKKVKAAKKNPQWKSKHKKDPGIPNNFPYKDQILAEIVDQRRVAAEEKQRRKDQKKIKKTTKDSDAEDEDEDMEDAASNQDNADEVFAEVKALGLAQGFDGIASLSAKRLDNTKLKPREVPMEVEEPQEEEVPILINRELPTLQAVLDEADVVIEVLDARDPLPFRSVHLEELASAKSGQRILLVLNKIDTCPREFVASWTSYLRAHHPTLPFRVASAFLPAGPEPVIKEKGKGKGKAKIPADNATGVEPVLECLGEWAEQKKGDKPLCVAVVGFTNVGKSSFVNSLLRKSALPIYTLATSSRGPTTTTYAQEVTIEVKGKPIRLIDTPGISWAAEPSAEDSEGTENIDNIRARDILMRSKGRIDRLKDPMVAVRHIVACSNTEDLMLFYSLPAFSAGDTDSFLSCVARAHQLVKKKGDLDLTGAARIVLRDWSVGKFPRYSVPPATSESATPLSPADEAVLATLQTRKDMRKARGLVKFTCGVMETRKASVDAPWAPESPEKDDEDEPEGGEDDEQVDDEMEDEEDGDEEEEDEEGSDDAEEELEPPIALSGKQKRKRAAEKAPPPRKKVSFGPDPKSSKQARSAAGSQARKPISAAVKEKPPKIAAPKKERKVANTAVKTKSSQKAAPAAGAAGQDYNFGEFF